MIQIASFAPLLLVQLLNQLLGVLDFVLAPASTAGLAVLTGPLNAVPVPVVGASLVLGPGLCLALFLLLEVLVAAGVCPLVLVDVFGLDGRGLVDPVRL